MLPNSLTFLIVLDCMLQKIQSNRSNLGQDILFFKKNPGVPQCAIPQFHKRRFKNRLSVNYNVLYGM